MPGIIIFKPIQAHFSPDSDSESEDDSPKQLKAYCKFKVGRRSGQSESANLNELHAEWSQAVKIETKDDDEEIKLKVKKEEKRRFDNTIGEVEINIEKFLDGKKEMTQWFHLEDGGKKTGEILLHIEYVQEQPEKEEKDEKDKKEEK